MTSIASITIEASEPEAASRFYEDAFGLGDLLAVRPSDAPTTGFRAYTLSLVLPQPSSVDSYLGTAIDAGATVLKPAAKSLWGYGGVVQAPDGAIWKAATPSKKEKGRPVREIDEVVLLIGASDVAASKQFYVDHGLTVERSFGKKYVEFKAPAGHVKLGLYGRKALSKDAGVPVDGEGSHRLAIVNDSAAFTDPDGFVWEGA
ncbi:glyoxalase [Mumia zhuanghuii]|uniref:Glyoxalase n=2 Tax=Mumia TaxID=1546255 RepID=A0ABW1QLM8_9ACTN|nr:MULTISPECIES: glyoxalase [Mumia]KAA1419847.1 glyoxalase [Mumia zhuanghuii]